MNGQIRAIRKAKALRQSDLPGVHRTVVSRIEREVGKPNLATLEVIAKALDVPLGSLLHDERTVQLAGPTPLPVVARMSLEEFLAELAHFFEGSGLEQELQTKEKWVQRCQWAMEKLLNQGI